MNAASAVAASVVLLSTAVMGAERTPSRDASVAAAATDRPVDESRTLRLVHTVPLPNTAGRFDHFAIDAAGRRLFIAALGNNTVEVIDLRGFARLKTIPGMRKPQGVLFAGNPARLYVANGDDGTLRVFDGQTLEPLSKLGDLDDADNVRCDEGAGRIYVGYGDGALGVTDFTAANRVQRIELKGHPESFQLERNGPRIFVNVPDADMVAVVDRTRYTVVAEWPVQRFKANFPMALDEASHRLFVGCRHPARLIVFATDTGKPVADLAIAGDTDDLAFDAKRQRIYVSGGEGFIDVIQCGAGDHYERIDRIATRGGARTSYFSPDLDQLFLAVPQRGSAEAELRVYQPN